MSGRGSGRGDRGGGRGGRGRGEFGGFRGGAQGGGGGRGGGDGGGRGRGFSGRGGPSDRGGRGGFAPSDTGIYKANQRPVAPQAAIKAENDLVEAMKALTVKTGPSEMPRRPGYGTVGTKVLVRANFFNLQLPKGTLYLYDVVLKPEVKNRRKKKRVFEILERHPNFANFERTSATDYSKLIVSTTPLNPKAPTTTAGQPEDRLEVEIMYTEVDGETPFNEDRARHTFTISRVAMIQRSHIDDYLQGNNPDFNFGQAVQALNIILAKFPNKSRTMVPVGRNKFFVIDDVSPSFSLGMGLTALKGYFTSVRPTINNMLVNVNVCTTAFYNPTNLARLIMEYLQINRHSDYQLWMMNKLKGFLKGVRVTINYLENMQGKKTIRGRTISGVAKLSPNKVKFDFLDRAKGTTRNISVDQYFVEKYNIRLQYPGLPAINIGDQQNPVFIPPEVATVVAGQAFMGKLPERLTSEMIKFACKTPKENAESIEKIGLPQLGLSGNNEELSPFQMRMSNDMVVVPARILPPPKINYQAGKMSSMTPVGASWNLQRARFIKPAALSKWSAMIIQEHGKPIDKNAATALLNAFRNNVSTYGMNAAACTLTLSDGKPAPVVTLPDARQYDSTTLVNLISPHMERFAKSGIPIVYVILPSTDKVLYSAIKYCGDMKHGVGTVCSQFSKATSERGQAQYFGNVALKFNLKLGGMNHHITIPPESQKLFDGTKTMLVGCDVTHPSPGSLKGVPSIAGVVASLDSSFVQFPGSLRMQKSKQEMIDNLTEMMSERLKCWFDKNGRKYPETIVVYRDGVSEGQYGQVLSLELPQIKAACEKIPNYQPKIAIIVVGKRHHTRFYPTDPSSADSDFKGNSTGNCSPGLVVDRGITSVYDYDFYIQAHKGLKGTARPAHYYVIYDRLGMGPDALQQFTHNLCFLFGRATKGVSICPPAYYADLICDRGRCYIHGLYNAIDDASTTKSLSIEEQEKQTRDKANVIWGTGIHQRLRPTMFYL